MASNPQHVQSVFLKAAEAPPEERGTVLARECGGDAELRQRVESLLAAHDRPDSLLDRPLVPFPQTEHGTPDAAAPGAARVGPYELIEKLGEGGMGEVWVASQDRPVKRRVALKLIRPGMDTAVVLRRFEQERQALALMEHTNIAKILDAGVGVRGNPYFAMELIRGLPLTTYCDEMHLTVRDRLGLFVDVCRAVQHAHQKGVIHRDLKPGNVLVAVQDGKPVPKVIDFGIAKAVGQQLTEETLYTGVGMVLGTLRYMSPEQAELGALDIDTRADVYALGVILYELLTGTTPLEAVRPPTVSFGETLRLIREQEPPRPSTRLSAAGQTLADLAAWRRSQAARLAKEVRGELDWIVMRALEKDRTRRYETADALARDVERFLADEPVEAGPPSAAYRVRKFVRRNRGPVLAAGVVVVALVGGIVGTTWGMVRANDARNAEAYHRGVAEQNERAALLAADAERQAKVRAERENRIAAAVRTFLSNDLLLQADPGIQADLQRLAGDGFEPRVNPTVRELLDRAAAAVTPDRIEGKFPGQPDVQSEVLAVLGSAFFGVREYARAADHHARSAELCHATFGPYDRRTLTVRTKLAWAYSALRQHDRAATTLHDVLTAAEREFGPDDRFTLQSANGLGQVYVQARRPDRAAPLFARVREAVGRALPPDDPLALCATHNVGLTLELSGQRHRAIPLYEEARDGAVRVLTADHPLALSFQKQLADAYLEDGQPDRAIAIYEHLPGGMTRRYGADDSRTLSALTRLSTAYLVTRRYDRAIPLLEQTRRSVVARAGPRDPALVNTLFQLATAYKATGAFERAVEAAEPMRDIAVNRWGVEDPRTVRVVHKLAEVCVAAGRGEQAAAAFAQFIPAKRKELGAENRDFAGHLALAASDLLKVGQFAAAEGYARECLRIREKVLRDTWFTPDARLLLGSALAGLGSPEAEAELLAAYDGLGKSRDVPPAVRALRLAEAADQLAALYTASGEVEKAEWWRAERTKYGPHVAPPPRPK